MSDDLITLKAELASERETIDDLLNQLQTMELESRAAKEEAEERERKLKIELGNVTRELDDERSIRLQQMYMLTRMKEECEYTKSQLRDTQHASKMNDIEFERTEAELKLTKRLLEDRDNDLRDTTQANLILKTESHQLRKRILEANQDTSEWRRKYEKVLESTAATTSRLLPSSRANRQEDRNGSSSMLVKNRQSKNISNKPQYGNVNSRQESSRMAAEFNSGTRRGSLPPVHDRGGIS